MNFSFKETRVYSIDTFRGITILVMIWVNEMAGITNISPWFKHMAADADAMSFVDMVFPAFLFIVGMSIPFAINTRLKKGDSTLKLWQHILMRFLGLIVLGLFMMNTEVGSDESQMVIPIKLWGLLSFIFAILIWNMYPRSLSKKVVWALKSIGWAGLILLAFLYKSESGGGMQIHWWGILGLIGWAYLISVFIYFFSKGRIDVNIFAIGILTVIYILVKNGSFPGNIFIEFLGGQLGHIIHASIVLSGTVISLMLFNHVKKTSHHRRVINVIVFMVFITIAGFVLRPYFTVSKIWATPSWAFYSVTVCIIIYLVFYYVREIKSQNRGFNWLQPAASNPLLIYILPYMLYEISSLFHLTLRPGFANSGLIGILWTMAYALFMIILVKWINKIHLRLHL